MTWLARLTQHYGADKKLAAIYGLILYTDAHAHVRKVLADEAYWRALHELSGDHWAIFSIRSKRGSYTLPESSDGALGFMVPVWKEPNDNKPILGEFCLQSSERLPVLLIFTSGSNDDIMKLTLSLDDTSLESAYSSLRTSIEVVTQAVASVLPEYRTNPEGVFQAIRIAVRGHKEWEMIKKGVRFAAWVKSVFW